MIMKTLDYIESWLVKLFNGILQICLILMTLGVFTQVLLRFFLKTTFLPIEDILPYSFSISTFAGSALLFREKGHIAITFLTDWIGGPVGSFVRFLSEVLSQAFILLFLSVGTEFMLSGRFQFSPLLKIPLIFIFSIIPLFAFASLVFSLQRYIKRFKNK